MKKNKITALLLLTLLLTLLTVCLTACSKSYIVTFYNEGSTFQENVSAGGKVSAPEDPERDDYIFDGWYLDSTKFDFDTPINSNIILIAKWTATRNTVAFMSNGEVFKTSVVELGKRVTRPATAPSREGYYFDGWYRGESKYDFSQPVTESFELTAKYFSRAELDTVISAALNADYSNYTATLVMTEYDSGEVYQYTNTYRRTPSAASFLQQQEGLADVLRYITYDSDGTPLAVFYQNDGEWKIGSTPSAQKNYSLAMDLNKLEPSDFDFVEGRFFILNDSIDAAMTALFGAFSDYNSSYYGVYFEIKYGHVTEIGCTSNLIDGGFVLNIADFGTTQVQLPPLPQTDVVILAEDKTFPAGRQIELEKILALFTISENGDNVDVKEKMLDLGGLDLDSPKAGVYSVTLSYTAKDFRTHNKSATVTIPAASGDNSLFDVFANAQDYQNATLTLGSNDYLINGDLIYWRAGTVDKYVKLPLGNETNYGYITYNTNTHTGYKYETPNWLSVPRLDLILNLDASLFKHTGDGVYVLDNTCNVDDTTLSQLAAIFHSNDPTSTHVFISGKSDLSGSNYSDDVESSGILYSLTVTVSNDCITNVSFFYYTKTGMRVNQQSKSFDVSNVGSTDTIEFSQEVLDNMSDEAKKKFGIED